MKIVSFTMVNNEAEIIESFVRYNYNFVDQMVIIDNGCTDNTIEIINRLKREEDYKIDVYDESLEVYDQFRLDNKYLKKILAEYNADIILPLDADEFISGEDNPRKILENLSLDSIYYVNWKWYVLTGDEDYSENFIPRRVMYHLKKRAWNLSDGTLVTKVIIPAKYFKDNKLTLTMGHHDIFGSNHINKKRLKNMWIAHYRAVSSKQIVSKTSTYVIRDIATMSNNIETAQRTNQLYDIKYNNGDVDSIARDVSYGGYEGEIEYEPLDLKFCSENTSNIRYNSLSNESMSDLLMRTGQEMAMRVYNLERKIKNRSLFKPTIFWLDGVRGEENLFPNPSVKLTLLTFKYNVQAYITEYKQIEFLKYNYRLIITPKNIKFLPHKYVVIPDENYLEIKNKLIDAGVGKKSIVSLREYKKKIGILGNIYANLCLLPRLISRIMKYVKRNGVSHAVEKIKSKLDK